MRAAIRSARLGPSLGRLLRVYGLLVALLALALIFALLIPGFATTTNMLNVSLQISDLVTLATGATIIMAVAEYDLSIGAMAGLGGVLAAELAIAGGRTVRDEWYGGEHLNHVVMQDPEGNEFCVA